MGQMAQIVLRKEIIMEISNTGDVFEQIINYYRKYISLGLLQDGDKMPSCRELAIKLGINHKTVVFPC